MYIVLICLHFLELSLSSFFFLFFVLALTHFQMPILQIKGGFQSFSHANSSNKRIMQVSHKVSIKFLTLSKGTNLGGWSEECSIVDASPETFTFYILLEHSFLVSLCMLVTWVGNILRHMPMCYLPPLQFNENKNEKEKKILKRAY